MGKLCSSIYNICACTVRSIFLFITSGKLLRTFSEHPLGCPVMSLAYHPNLHVVVCGGIGASQPVLVLASDTGTKCSSNRI